MVYENLTIYQQISVILFCVLSVYLGFLTIHLVSKAKKAEEERKFYFLSIAFFSALYMVCRILMVIDAIDEYPKLSPLYIYGSFFAVLGVVGLMFAVERYVYQKLKYLPTICIFIFSLLIILIPGDATSLVTYWVIIGTAFAILIPILYLKVGFNSTGEIRKNSYSIAIGILIFLVGNGINAGDLTTAIEIFFILAPIAMMIGLVMLQIGLK